MTAPTNRTSFAGSAAPQSDPQLARRWAQDVLGLDTADDPRALRAAALARLADDEFILWPQAHVAVTLLAGGELTDEDQCTLAEGVGLQLREEVEEFCRKFFRLPREERLVEWMELARRCRHYPALDYQLRRLEAGLACEPVLAPRGAGLTESLLNHVCNDFVAWQPDAAKGRRTLLRFCREDPGPWRQAAGMLLKQPRHGAVELVPGLVKNVRDVAATRRRISRRRRARHLQAIISGPMPHWTLWIPASMIAGAVLWLIVVR